MLHEFQKWVVNEFGISWRVYEFSFNNGISSGINLDNRSIVKELIDRDLFSTIINFKVSCSNEVYFEKFTDDYYFYNDCIKFLDWYYNCNVVNVFNNYFRNNYRKVKRVKEKINNEIFANQKLWHGCYFLTLTLREDLGKDITSEKYDKVRKEVRKFVSNYSRYYVLNKDFGTHATKRLHFHGVALINKGYVDSFKVNYNLKFGFCKLQLIDVNSIALSKYIIKLSYHALKVDYGKKRECLIYSRYKAKEGDDVFL